MNNIIYIGRFLPAKQLEIISSNSRGRFGLSNHNFEMSIINGLCQQEEIRLHCLSIPEVYSYPHNNRRLYTKAESYQYKNTSVYTIGFCNFILIKEIWSTISLSVNLIKLLFRSTDNQVDIIINTPNNNLLNAVKIAKLFTRKQITQTVIIPDIPSMITAMDKQNRVKSFFLKYLNRSSMNKASNSDGLVLLTESMMNFINKPLKYIVMEGIVDLNTMDVDDSDSIPNKEIILYTGSLRKIFGVTNLLAAFKMIERKDVELWICGSGDAKDIIEDEAKKDTRIKFWGLVDSRTALKMQHQATVLVNPRTSDGEYTRYSFPSKTMEYLLSGKSVIINKLPGIPEEYYQYVYTPKDENIQSLYECINDVLSMDTQIRRLRSSAGRQFIIENKNSLAQTSRILEMIRMY